MGKAVEGSMDTKVLFLAPHFRLGTDPMAEMEVCGCDMVHAMAA